MFKEYLKDIMQFIYKKFSRFINKNDEILLIQLRKDISFKIKCNTSRGYIDIRLKWENIYETNITNLIINNIKQNCIFIDIGANIGYYTLLASRLLNSNSYIYSFEPVTETFKVLNENIDLNNINNVKAFKIALGSEDKKEKILLSEEAGLNSIVSNRKVNRNKIKEEIIIKKLDTIINFENENIFLKIDIEGYEFEALKGMSTLLINNKCKIVFEYTPKFFSYFMKDTVEYSLNMFNYLNHLGYHIFEIGIHGEINKINDFVLYSKKNKNKQKNIYAQN